MKKLICIILLLAGCSRQTSDTLFLSILDDPEHPRALFSFPGRFTDPELKMNVKKRILEILDSTNNQLDIFAYSLNDPDILNSIIKIHEKGIPVHVRGDRDSDYQELIAAGIPLSIWTKSGIHHVKVIVSDNRVFTGTGNFTAHGLTNDYNGYIEFQLSTERRSDFVLFMEERYPNPVFYTNGMFFLSSPNEGSHIQKLLFREMEKANSSVEYLIFNHFDELQSHILRKIYERGVRVNGIYNQPVSPEGKYLSEKFNGITSWIAREGNEDLVFEDGVYKAGLLHHKTMIVDGKTLLTGSYNYSLSARDNNREIMIMSELPQLVRDFSGEFTRIKNNSYLPDLVFTPEPDKYRQIYPENDLCFSENMQKPVLETGEGLFKNYAYFPDWNTNCYPATGFKSSTMPGELQSSDMIQNSIKEGGVFRSRESQEGYFVPSFPVFFARTEKAVFMQVDSIVITKSKYAFTTEIEIPADSKIYLWTPGRVVVNSILQQNTQGYYIADLALDSLQIKKALLLIPMGDKYYIFCHDEGEDKSIEWIRKEYSVMQSILQKKEIIVPSCIKR